MTENINLSDIKTDSSRYKDDSLSIQLPKYKEGYIWIETEENIVRLPIEVIKNVVLNEYENTQIGICGICRNMKEIRRFEGGTTAFLCLCDWCYNSKQPEFKELLKENSPDIVSKLI